MLPAIYIKFLVYYVVYSYVVFDLSIISLYSYLRKTCVFCYLKLKYTNFGFIVIKRKTFLSSNLDKIIYCCLLDYVNCLLQ